MRTTDADELKRRIIAFATGCHTTYLTVDNIIMLLNQADTVDAVPVVRCKGCKHWRHSGNNIFGPEYGTCVECLMDTKADFFCGFGERWPE